MAVTERFRQSCDKVMALVMFVCLGSDKVTLQLVYAFCEKSFEFSDLAVLI